MLILSQTSRRQEMVHEELAWSLWWDVHKNKSTDLSPTPGKLCLCRLTSNRTWSHSKTGTSKRWRKSRDPKFPLWIADLALLSSTKSSACISMVREHIPPRTPDFFPAPPSPGGSISLPIRTLEQGTCSTTLGCAAREIKMLNWTCVSLGSLGRTISRHVLLVLCGQDLVVRRPQGWLL